MKSLIAFLALSTLSAHFVISAPLRLACVGDSITAGVGAAKDWSYPAQLQRMLGPGYDVRNFGVSGATLLRNGDRPYEKQAEFKAALDFKPDLVILMLGTNDTKPQNWGPHAAEFDGDYRWLVGQLKGSNPSQKLFACLPCWVAAAGRYGINELVLEHEIPLINKIVSDLHLPEIDMHAALEGHSEDLPDTVHPNNIGATLMAKAAFKAITGNNFPGNVPLSAPSSTAVH
jgi:lysophospholipase L1-like esterase